MPGPLTKPFELAGAYGRAAALVRAGRRAGENFDSAFMHAQRVGITQKREEIAWLYGFVSKLRPQRVLEIGTDLGGTLFLWTRAAAPEARLIAVDTRPLGRLGVHSPFAVALRGFAGRRQRVDLLMPADSHDPDTRRRIEGLLGDEPVDFLFLDGDHSREGVRRDFEAFAPLVRRGGLVGFHDVSQRTTPVTEGVAAFWREFRREHETDERVADGDPGFGIGVYRVPS